jgi:opacity protein-like surface antigen
MRGETGSKLCLLGLAGLFAAASPLLAQEADSAGDAAALMRRLDEESEKLRALERSLGEQERRLAEDRRALEEQRGRLQQLMQQLTGRGPAPSAATAQSGPAAQSAPAAQPAPATQSAQAGTPAAKDPVGEAPPQAERPPDYAQIFQEPGVLTPRGKFVLEPSLQYLQSSNNRVALVGFAIIPAITIGLIDVRQVSRNTFIGALTGRYGLTERFELEGKVPYVYSTSETLTRPLATPSVTDSFFDAKGYGIGDVEVAARYQLNAFRGDNAVYVGSLRAILPTGKGPFDVDFEPITGLQTELATGSGFFGLQAGVTGLVPSDPAVFFGGLTYQYNFPRDVGNGFGTITPGNIASFNLGMGLALNDRASFSVGFQFSNVSKSSQEGADSGAKTLAPSSTIQLGTARLGVSYRLSSRTNLNFTLGFGVTRQTPDLELTVRVPFSF